MSEVIEEYRNTIQKGDCLDVLSELPENSVDVVVTDPPYNFSTTGTDWDEKDWDIYERGGDMSWDEYGEFTSAWLGEVDRVVKPDGAIWVFGTYHNTPYLNLGIREIGQIINEIVWIKRNAFPNIRQSRLAASHETLYWGSIGGDPDEYTFNYDVGKQHPFTTDQFTGGDTQLRTIWDIPTNKASVETDYSHPAQKPLRLLDRVILIGTNPGDVVLDPFTGSGAIPASASLNGRDYIGIERDEEYVDVAREYVQSLNEKPEIVKRELDSEGQTSLDDF